jgi:hypothetical protein
VKDKAKKIDTRPLGTSSRLRKISGPKMSWLAPNGQSVELPVEVDILHIDEVTGKMQWLVLAKVHLVESKPALASIEIQGFPAVDPAYLQRFFRWRTPIDIIFNAVPDIMSQGIDPYEYDYAVDGYPDAANIAAPLNQPLSDEFLTNIAKQYKEIGRGYAKVIAAQRGVSNRTVVSWVEKARKRGLLPPTKSGKASF